METKTKRIKESIGNDARNPSKNKLHIIPYISKGWGIVSEGKVRAIRFFPTKNDAISFAKSYIDKGEVEIHNSNGTLDSRIVIQ